ncbi:MAG: hypothetical protein QOC94_2780 [Actinoplanes sp.]|nr:hypothetical protein [Actinoplanes sp.]
MTGDLSRGLSDMWRSVLLFVPTALAFIAILIIGYILARVLRTVVAKGLHRVGIDRAVERGALGRAVSGGKLDASDLLAKIAFYAVLLFALQLAFGIWGPNAVSDLLTALIAWLPRAFVAIVIIVVAAAIAGAAHDLIANALGGLAYGRLLARAASILIITLGVIAALDQVRIATSVTQPLLIAVLATVAGVLIVGVGGGMIRPMQQRWEGWLDKAGEESTAIREYARTYADEKARVAAEAEAARIREAEEARQAEEARKAEEARLAEQARLAEEARKAEEVRLAEEARVVEEARQAAEDWRAEEVRAAEEARKAELARQAEESRPARAAGAVAGDAETADLADTAVPDDHAAGDETAGTGGAATRRSGAVDPGAAEETQVIPVQVPRQRPDSVDDRAHPVPGFDRDESVAADPDATTVLPGSGEAERTQALPRSTDQTAIDEIPAVSDDIPDSSKSPFRRRS